MVIITTNSFSQSTAKELTAKLNPRIKISLDDNWKFYNENYQNAELKNVNDTNWESINIPHTWNSIDAFSDSTYYRRGIGWYRKSFNISEDLKGKKIYLYFEGANITAEVFINGKSVGKHIGGYTAFTFDITNEVDFSEKNIIAVKVDNLYNSNIPPLDADFTFYGGIYRDVWLIAVNPVHIDLDDNASSGIFITTPEVSLKSAAINIRGKVVNQNSKSEKIKVVNKILDKDNHEIKVIESELNLKNNSYGNFNSSLEIDNPNLWSPDDPYLYKILTEIYVGNILVDEVINPLGIRWFKFDAQKGFFLNGKHLKLIGTTRHQDYPQFANALPNWAHQKDLKIIKDNGFNFLRLAHYPQDPTVLQTADEIGLIIWEEIPVVNTITLTDEFNNNCKNMLVEMIRQHFNHPSIFLWGYMNEIRLRPPKELPEGYFNKITELEKALNDVAKKEDSTRATVTANFSGEIENADGYENIPDVIGMNLYFGWYYNDFKTFGNFVDKFHNSHPNTPIIISEYGGGSDERIHSRNPKAFDFSTEYQQNLHEDIFSQIREREFLSGSILWNQFDFGSKFRDDTKPNINQKGIYYFDRTPKDISYYYKASSSKEPVLHLAVLDYLNRAGSRPEDRKQNFKVYTNLNDVEIFLNNKTLGIFNPKNFTINFNGILHDGKNSLIAKAFQGSIEILDKAIINYDDRTFLFESKNSDGRQIAVNCGGTSSFIDQSGLVWESDKEYKSGSWGYSNGNKINSHHRIYGTVEEPLFQSANDSVSFYQFDLPDGLYEVRLKFCEIENKNDIKRIFNIKINNQTIFERFNPAEKAENYSPTELSSQILVKDGTGIKINFEKLEGNTLINGISFRKIY